MHHVPTARHQFVIASKCKSRSVCRSEWGTSQAHGMVIANRWYQTDPNGYDPTKDIPNESRWHLWWSSLTLALNVSTCALKSSEMAMEKVCLFLAFLLPSGAAVWLSMESAGPGCNRNLHLLQDGMMHVYHTWRPRLELGIFRYLFASRYQPTYFIHPHPSKPSVDFLGRATRMRSSSTCLLPSSRPCGVESRWWYSDTPEPPRSRNSPQWWIGILT